MKLETSWRCQSYSRQSFSRLQVRVSDFSQVSYIRLCDWQVWVYVEMTTGMNVSSVGGLMFWRALWWWCYLRNHLCHLRVFGRHRSSHSSPSISRQMSDCSVPQNPSFAFDPSGPEMELGHILWPSVQWPGNPATRRPSWPGDPVL